MGRPSGCQLWPTANRDRDRLRRRFGGGGGGGRNRAIPASRKYVDLIHEASESTRWANWDPSSKQIKVGSYGRFDPESGCFQVHGNIYDLPAGQPSSGQRLYTEGPTESASIRESTTVTSDVECLDIGPVANVIGVPRRNKQWKFSSQTGALLMMWNYRTVSLPQSIKDAILDPKDKELSPELEGLMLVTSVYNAQAYLFYLSNRSSESIQVDLKTVVHAPTPTAPRARLGIELNTDLSNASDRPQYAASDNGHFDYTPVFECENIEVGAMRDAEEVEEDEEEEDDDEGEDEVE